LRGKINPVCWIYVLSDLRCFPCSLSFGAGPLRGHAEASGCVGKFRGSAELFPG
jgi:hypothetical protein